MADKRITDFATLPDAQDDDLLLVASEDETYNMKVKTLKEAVKGDADRAEAAAKAAQESAETASTQSAEALNKAKSAEKQSQEAKTAASQAAINAGTAADAANASAASAAEAEQALIDATEAVASVNEFAKDFNDMKAVLEGKVDDAYVEEGYLYLTSNDEVVAGPLGPFSGDGSGGGGGAGSTIRITNGMESRAFSVMDGVSVIMAYAWTATDTEDGSAIGDGTAIWRVNGTKVATQNVAQGDNTFDITKYLTPASANTVKLTIEDAYGNSKSFTWTVTVSTYGLTWNLGKLATHGSSLLTVRLVPTGDGTKTIHITCDGEEVFTKDVDTTGRTISATINPQSHGSHVILAWLETTANGEIIETTPLRHVGIWTETGNYEPVIAVYNDTVDIPQFSTGLIEYMVYDPLNQTCNVSLLEGYETLSELTVDRNIQQWAYRATKTQPPKLSIRYSETNYKEITVNVESLGYDINPVTEGLVLDIDPTGHSNSETDRAEFGYTDGEGVNHPFTFSDNFDWINGGFQLDSEGVTAFVIKRGTYIQADRSLFNDNATSTGKAIKVVFKATNVRNYDAEIMNCVSGNIGLVLQAQQAILSSELKSAKIPYCEERQIEMDINIEASNENRLATVWLRGQPSRGFNYTASDNWAQANPVLLKIGSEDCDVWIYRIKMYGNSLTRYEILDNFIADCGNAEEMVNRYLRNAIYNDNGTININNLASANPNLRILKISADRMTTGKEDVVSCTVQLVYVNGGAEHNFTATGVLMKVQGTSSAAYGEAAYNVDLDFSEAVWTLEDGTVITEYAMTANSIPVKYFNIKLNVASSENANNVCLADDYNTYQPFLTAARRANAKVRDTVEGHACAVFFTNTSGATISVGARTVQPNETILYGCGDMNNSKKNFAVFGQDNATYPEQCCVEFLNNIADQCRFKSDDLSGEDWSGDVNFEFRFPKNPTDSMKAAFQEMLSWVVSTDTTAATGNALTGGAVTINGTTYTNDTAEYRAAKFVEEFENYFSKDSMLYHYLFTERHCMIDNRAKNVFFSYEYDPDVQAYRWNVTKDYDNDTGEGNDNEGGLTFTYGIEDTDTVGTKMAFNASDSVLWCNIRDYMADDLEAMFKNREAAGAWNAERILKKFADYQACRPEALVIEDMWGKYFTPYIANGNTAYIDMMHGPKYDQRTQFETYQERYMSTKYYGSVATSDAITFRGNTPTTWAGVEPTGDFAITPYADMYIIVKYGSQSVRIRAKRGISYPVICPVAEALSDTEIYLYLASNIVEITSVAGLYCQYIDLAPASRLRKFIAGSDADGYANHNLTSISFGNNELLEYIDLRGTPALAHDLDLSLLTSLVTLYLTGSGVTGVTFALGAPVEVAELCAVSSLVARRLSALTKFTMDGSNLLKIWVEESPVIDTLAAVKAATRLNRGRLPDVEWSTDTADTVVRLAGLAGLDENGEPNVAKFVLEGNCHIATVSQEELDTLMSTFLKLSLTYGTMVESYTVTFQLDDGTVLNTQTVRQYGSAVNPVSAGLIGTPIKAPTVDKVFTFIGWDVAFNYILGDLTVTAVFSEAVRTYTVRFYSGSSLLQTDVVEAYAGTAYRGEELISSTGAIWMGWDKPTNSVTSDMDVYALFVSPTLPDTVASGYDYLYSDNPEDNSGYTLAEFYGIIASGKSKEYFSVGDEIKIVPITDVFVDTEIVLQVYGFNHYRLADGSGDFANVVFGMKGVMNATRQMNTSNTNVGGWDVTAMRKFLNESIFPALPQQWRAMIKTVETLSSAGNTSADIVTSEDNLFLFSQAEVGFSATVVPYCNEVDADAEEITFSIFTDNASRIKKRYNGEGDASSWWLRSPTSSYGTYFCHVYTGGSSYTNGAGNSFGVAFGFCI